MGRYDDLTTSSGRDGAVAEFLPLPLQGIRVVDLTWVVSGPYATMTLGDLGAEVIKVERPGSGDDARMIPPRVKGESHYFLSMNRNKRSVVVDVKRPEGVQVVLDLIARSHVVVENFRPGVARRLGLDFPSAQAVNPAIVYCSISAFGQSGPWSGRSGFDIVIQAMSGMMSVTGEPGGAPLRTGIPLSDLSSGLFATVGILAALVDARQTGRGRHVDVAMLDSSVGLLGYLAGRYFMTGESPTASGNGHLSIVPYGAFPAADGYVVLAIVTEPFWPKLCLALDRPDLADDPRFATSEQRVAHREAVDAAIAATMRTRTVQEWCARLAEADVPHAPVLSVADALRHEQAVARGLVREVDHPVLGRIQSLGPVVRFPDAGEPPVGAPPTLGADTGAVLRDVLSYPPDRIEDLIARAVVGVGSSLPVEEDRA